MFTIQDKAILICHLYQAPDSLVSNFDSNDVDNDDIEVNNTYYNNTLNSVIQNYGSKIIQMGESPLMIPEYISKFYHSINKMAELRVELKKDSLEIQEDLIKWNPLVTKTFLYQGAGINLKLKNWSLFSKFEANSKDDLMEKELLVTKQMITDLAELKAIAYGLIEVKNEEIPALSSIINSLKDLCDEDSNKLIF
jgi:hypothetical protein